MLQTVDQIAARLNVSRATVWRYCRCDPEFPKPVKLSPGCSRWHAHEVQAWLDGRERATAA